MKLVVAGIAACLLLAACGGANSGPPPSAAGTAFSIPAAPLTHSPAIPASLAFHAWVDNVNRHAYGDNYDNLVTDQQALFSKDVYVACQLKDGSQTPIVKWDKVLASDPHAMTIIPGTTHAVEATAVTVQISSGGDKESVTAHMLAESGEWHWMADEPTIDSCKA